MAVALILPMAADPRLKSAENGSLCLVFEHLSNGDDTRLNRCLELADPYNLIRLDSEVRVDWTTIVRNNLK